MVLDIEGYCGVEVLEAVKIEQSLFEDVQLGAYVKYEQAQKGIDACVRNRGQYDRRSLSGDYKLVIRGLRYVSQKIRLHQHRPSRVRVRQIYQVSRCIPKARWNDENDCREHHHATPEYDYRSGNFRLLYHGISFLRCFRLVPILYDHFHDRFEIFGEGCKNMDLIKNFEKWIKNIIYVEGKIYHFYGTTWWQISWPSSRRVDRFVYCLSTPACRPRHSPTLSFRVWPMSRSSREK